MDKQLSQLESVLRQQIAAHDRLLSAMALKMDAIRQARPQDLPACLKNENEALQLVAELEKQRLSLAAELTRLLNPSANAPCTLRELAERLEEPRRGRLLILRETLRQKASAVQRGASVAHLAAETLARHMQGIVHAISGAMTGIMTYTRRGSRPSLALAASTFSATG
jgi:hypothetical protein